jgi:hypothetical protein
MLVASEEATSGSVMQRRTGPRASLARQTNHSKMYQPPAGAGANWNARRHGLKCLILPLFNADPVGLKAEGIRFTYGLVDRIWLDWLGSLA